MTFFTPYPHFQTSFSLTFFPKSPSPFQYNFLFDTLPILYSNKMSQSAYCSKKILHSLNEKDLVEFYTSSDAMYPSKMSIISLVCICDTRTFSSCLSLTSTTQHRHINLVPILPCYLTIGLREIFPRISCLSLIFSKPVKP